MPLSILIAQAVDVVVQKIIQIIDLLPLSWAIQPQLKNRKIESGLLKVNRYYAILEPSLL